MNKMYLNVCIDSNSNVLLCSYTKQWLSCQNWYFRGWESLPMCKYPYKYENVFLPQQVFSVQKQQNSPRPSTNHHILPLVGSCSRPSCWYCSNPCTWSCAGAICTSCSRPCTWSCSRPSYWSCSDPCTRSCSGVTWISEPRTKNKGLQGSSSSCPETGAPAEKVQLYCYLCLMI